MVVVFELGRRDIAERPHEPTVVEPIDPGERGALDVIHTAPWPVLANDLGLVEAIDRLGQGVVVGVADRSDRGLEAGLRLPFGVADGQILAAAVAVMDNSPGLAARPECLLQGIEHEVGLHRFHDAPSDNPA